MAREVLIDTPENVALEYELAGLGTRFTANLADTAFQALIMLGLTLFLLLVDALLVTVARAQNWGWLTSFLRELTGFVGAGAAILFFLIFWGYYVYFEFRWNGQTPGKRSAGLRVLREGGYPVDLFSVILRNLLRIIDFFPAFYFVGMASILMSRNYQRVGDLLGGTVVVKERAPRNLLNLLQATRLQPEHLDRDALNLMMREADRLTPDEYRAVRHFTERRRALPNWTAQQQAARVLAIPLMERLHIAPPPGVQAVNYADVLEYLAVAYETARRPKEMRPVDVAPAAVAMQPVATNDAVAVILSSSSKKTGA